MSHWQEKTSTTWVIIGSGFGLKLPEAFHHTKMMLILLENPGELSVRNLAKLPCRGGEGCRGCSVSWVSTYYRCGQWSRRVQPTDLACCAPVYRGWTWSRRGSGRNVHLKCCLIFLWRRLPAGALPCWRCPLLHPRHLLQPPLFWCPGFSVLETRKKKKKACLLHAPLCMLGRCLLWPQATLTQTLRQKQESCRTRC